MTIKKSMGLGFLFLFLLSSGNAEILTWKANAGQHFEATITRQESVVNLDFITVKPTVVTTATIEQDQAAKNKSTIGNIRGIPDFPPTAVEPGSRWTGDAVVSCDLKPFGLSEPVELGVHVDYTLLEITIINSRSFFHIRAEWYPLWIPDAKTSRKTGISRLSGYSNMDIYWDNKSGSPEKIALSEEVQYRFNEGSQLLTRRETRQEFKTATEILREQVVTQLNSQIASQKVANVEVKQSDEGIVLSIENIQFDAESVVLPEAEKAKLTKIGKLLSSLQGRKLSVVGHAAITPGSSEAELLALSTGRAKAVADFLVQTNIKSADMIISGGMGGSKPVATNDTPEGRSKNRRVEIVILDEEVTQ